MLSKSALEPFLVKGPAGHLEALLEMPKTGDPVGMAVICHPHPSHGGAMQNKVVHTLSRAFALQQFAALRFNFRGVGKSEGSFDDGEGEIQDALAAVSWIKEHISTGPLWLAGFSFGGAIAIHAAIKSSAAGLISVAPATSRFANDLDQQPQCPWLIVQGDQDELVDINETIDYVNSLDPGPQLSIFPEGEHFFHGRLIELRDTVEDFIRKN